MKNRLLFIFFGVIGLIAFAGKASAQCPSLSLGPEVVFPWHNTSHGYESDGYYRDGGGFSAMFELPLADKIKFTLSAAYQFYEPVDMTYVYQVYYTCLGCTVPTQPPVNNSTFAYIPLTAGFKYYFYKYLFLGIEAGDAINAGNRTVNSFIYGGSFGGEIPLTKHNLIELSTGTEDGFKSTIYDYPITQIYLKAAYKYQF